MEHMILWAICVLIIAVRMPQSLDTDDDTIATTCICVALSVPLFISFEVIFWIGKFYHA